MLRRLGSLSGPARLRRPYSAPHREEESCNEPGGYFLGHPPGQFRWPRDLETNLFVFGYLGGLALFMFLWQYKPETSAKAWARQEAIHRMRARGIDV
jgi:hypothetical protein